MIFHNFKLNMIFANFNQFNFNEFCKSCKHYKGSFTYDVITLGGGGGGFQMMTIDDEGEGGVWPMMTSS